MIAYREMTPPAALADWIHRIWYLRDPAPASAPQPVVPDGRAEIVLHLAEPFGHLDRYGEATRQETVMVAGQLTGPQWLRPSAEVEVLGIRLTPAGAGALLGIPMRELADTIVPLRAVGRPLAASLLDAVARRTTAAQRLRAVLDVLGRHATRQPDPLVRRALQALDPSAGVTDLARRCGVTPRTLQRRFREAVGLRPKLMARLSRFRRAYRLLNRSPGVTARVAALTGYFDQAHLIRDFRQFAGDSPARFFHGSTDLASAFLAGDDG